MFGLGHGHSLSLAASRPMSAPFVGALDGFTAGLLIAFSIWRRLLTDYTGPLIRVRRDSDNAELDIGYNAAGFLDIVALLVFVGAGDGFIVKIYNQDGSGNDGSQSTLTYQPKIVSAGSVLTCGGLAAAQFDGTNDTLNIANLVNTTGGPRAYSGILQSTGATWNNYGGILDQAGPDATESRLGLMLAGSTSFYTAPTVAGVRKNGAALSSPGFNMTTINAAMVLSVDTATPTGSAVGLQIAASANSYFLDCSLSELVAWSATADRTAFEANQKEAIGL